MEKEFWLERWERSEIGFHEGTVNAYLQKYWPSVKVGLGDKVFVPLCGKSVDLRWLHDQGFGVMGVELSRIAVEAFYREQEWVPQIQAEGSFDRYEANGVSVLWGDFFNLSREKLAGVQAVYDRASMVALPPPMRERYAEHLLSMLEPGVQILLVAFDYPQSEMSGPPFALPSAEIAALFGNHADIEMLEEIDALPENPRFASRGVSRLHERIYLLTVR